MQQIPISYPIDRYIEVPVPVQQYVPVPVDKYVEVPVPYYVDRQVINQSFLFLEVCAIELWSLKRCLNRSQLKQLYTWIDSSTVSSLCQLTGQCLFLSEKRKRRSNMLE